MAAVPPSAFSPAGFAGLSTALLGLLLEKRRVKGTTSYYRKSGLLRISHSSVELTASGS